MIDFILGFVVYNLIWIVLLLLFFIIIYLCIHKLKKPVVLFHAVFDVFDIVYNWQLSLLFLELPKTYNETISDRFRRYIILKGLPEIGTPMNIFRYEIARFFAKILNHFDEGHI